MGKSIFRKFLNLFKKTKKNDQDGAESISDRYGINAETITDNPLYSQESVGDRYGTDEGSVYTNPFFDAIGELELKKQEISEQELPKQELPENELPEQELPETATQTEAETETETETDPEPETQSSNRLKNIGGMPTRDSIKKMLDVQSLGKLEKHKHFDKAFAALALYQDIMQREHKVVVDEAGMRRCGEYKKDVELAGKGDAAVDEAWLAMSEFICQANLAVKGATGFFAGRSGTVQRLTPVFANLLMQAYGLLPKLSHLESAIAPYLLEMKKVDEEYTLDEVLNHRVTGGRSGGLATRGLEEDSAIIISPQEALDAIKNKRKRNKKAKKESETAEKKLEEAEKKLEEVEKKLKDREKELNDAPVDKKGLCEKRLNDARNQYKTAVKNRNKAVKDKRAFALGGMNELRSTKTKKARMALTIPTIPDGVLCEEYGEAVSGEQKKLTEKKAEEIATAYITELRLRMTALQDVAESYEFSGETERAGVHDKQAEYFRMSRLLYRVISNKDLLQNIILKGGKNMKKNEDTGYQDMEALQSVAGLNLSAAVKMLNNAAMDEDKYERLADEEGNALQEEEDYHVGGGNTSVSILDFHNQRVLRSPKNLSKEQQKTALNGIKDEAAGKVSQFLGFNVCAQAEAKGFMAKEKGSDQETPVFGGSIMEMAKGKESSKINLMMRAGDDSKVKKNQYQNLELVKQGRLLGDFMKMNVLDYIILHGDRNAGNFMINLEAGDNESTVTAIDNDMILGCDNNRNVGETSSAHALNGVNNNIFMEFGFKLQTAFPMMTKEVKDTLEGLDLQALSDLLMPYADRVSRLAAVHRAAELKEWAKKVPTCDLTTEKGTREYVKIVMERSMTEWVRGMNLKYDGELENTSSRLLPNMLAQWVVSSSYDLNSKFSYQTTPDYIVKIMNVAGLSKEQIKKIFMENLSSSDMGDVAISEEEFNKSSIAKALSEASGIEDEKLKWDDAYVL